MIHSLTFPGRRFTGNGFIAGESPGIVTVASAPAQRKVVLMEKSSLIVAATQVSAANGTYRFSRIDENRRYVVMAFDHQLQFNAVIRDNITPAEEA